MKRFLLLFQIFWMGSGAAAPWWPAFALREMSAGEVRPGGNNTNGGWFAPVASVCSSPGTDYTQQDAAQVTFDGATITATTSGTSNTITITGYTVAATDNCNTLRVASGTNFTAGLYTIQSVNVGANTWTLNGNVTSGAGVAMVGKMGGGMATLRSAMGDVSNHGQMVWWQQPGETITTTLTLPAFENFLVHGYDVTHGDSATRPLLQSATNSVNLITSNSTAATSAWVNVNFKHTAATRGNCFVANSGQNVGDRSLLVAYSLLDGCQRGFDGDNNNHNGYWAGLYLFNVEVKNSINSGIYNDGATHLTSVYSHDNAVHGLIFDGNVCGVLYVESSTFASNGSNGILHQATSGRCGNSTVRNNNFWTNGGDGYRQNDANQGSGVTLLNNLAISNGGWGIIQVDADGTAGPSLARNNGFYNNASGTISNSSPDPWTTAWSNNITLTGDPFTAPASGDFSLNPTAGAGAAALGAGLPGVSTFGTGYISLGALEPQAGGAAATVVSGSIQ